MPRNGQDATNGLIYFKVNLNWKHFCLIETLKKTKNGFEIVARQIFDEADEDGNGTLSVIECICLLPRLESLLKFYGEKTKKVNFKNTLNFNN